MRIGIYFDGFSPIKETMAICRQAEEAGTDSLWFAQHMGYREAFMSAMAVAVETRKVKIVPTAITPYLWPALPVAMSMATLDEIAPARTKIAISVGNLLNLSESGVEASKPVKVLREYTHALRELGRGAAVHQSGEIQKLVGAHMEFGKDANVPIYIASTGPQVLNLAGQIGDGILLSAGMTLQSCRKCLDNVDRGAKKIARDPGSVRKAGFINFNVSKDGDSAKRALLRKLAYLFRSRGHAENIKSSGLDIDHQGIIDCLAKRDLDGATKMLPLEAADVFGVAGAPNECRNRLEEYLKIGIDEPIIEVSGSLEERQLALEIIRELARE